MKKKQFYFLPLMILIGITACNNIKFRPPLGPKYLISCVNKINEFGELEEQKDCACIYDDLRDDEPAKVLPIEECSDVIGVKPDYYLELEQFYQDKLTRLEICLKYPRKCR